MMTERNGRIVGVCSGIFGFILVVTCSVYLHYILNLDCAKGDQDYWRNYYNNADRYGSHYVGKREASNYGYLGASGYCKSPPALTFCAGFGLTIALSQIILSVILCSARKKNTKIFSIVWAVGHLLICIGLFVIFVVDLSHDWKREHVQRNYKPINSSSYRKSKEVAFLVIVALDWALVIALIGFVSFLLMKKSDYQDYSTDETHPDDPIVYRAQ